MRYNIFSRSATALVFMAMTASSAFADFSISAQVERAQGTLGEVLPVQLIITSDKEIPNIQAPSLPAADWFLLVKTDKSQSSSMSINSFNGQMTKTVTTSYIFQYDLQLKKEGTFTFPPLTFTANSQTKSTNPIQISVGKESKEEQGLVSISLGINHTKLYVGEQPVLTLRVSNKANTQIDFPGDAFPKAVKTIIESAGNNFSISLLADKLTQKVEPINGVPTRIVSLAFSIVPLHAGSITLPSLPFSYNVYKQSSNRRARDPFEDFFGGDPFMGGQQIERVTKATASIPLNITAISPPNPPAGFSGAVGEFNMSATISGTTTAAGQGVTMTISQSGNCRPGTLADPVLPTLPELDAYTPEKSMHVDTSAEGFHTYKTSKYLVVPKREGKLSIPPISFIYFDPQSASYKTASTKQFDLTVTHGSGTVTPQVGGLVSTVSQTDVKQQGNDIRWIHTPSVLKQESTMPWKSLPLLLALLLPFVLAILTSTVKIYRYIREHDPVAMRRRKARSVAIAALDEAHEKHDAAIAVEATFVYLSTALGIPARGATGDELRTLLVKKKLPEALVAQTTALLSRFEDLRFAGRAGDIAAVSAIVTETKTLIDAIESKRRGAK